MTGLKASLEKSLDTKKNAGIVEDSIDAEELGRFPDSDVADSLEHLPGITITRTTGGEGQKVSVRGFGPQYNIVTLNNRILATDDDGRDLAFDVLPSEVISGADVLKSSEASALEGSIGGTVNLRTASPFENPGLHTGVHAEGNYNDMSTLYGKKFSAFIENTMLDNTLGFLVGGVVSNNQTRTDSLNAFSQNIYGPTSVMTADGATVPVSVSPCCITFGSIFDTKKREALSGSLEWRPNDHFSLIADGLWTKLEDDQIGYNQSYYYAQTTDTRRGIFDMVEPDGQQRAGDRGHFEQLHARDRQQHDRSQRRHFALRSQGHLDAQRQVQVELRWISLCREPAGGRCRHVRDGGPGVEPAGCGGLHYCHRHRARLSEPQRDGSAGPARPERLPRRNGEQDHGGHLLLYGTDEFGRPQQ